MKRFLNLNRKKIHVILSVIAIVTIVLTFMTVPAFAEGTGDVLEQANLGGVLGKIYSFFTHIGLPAAILGLVMCAFSFFLPDEKKYEAARVRMRNIGIAIMVVMILPFIYSYASNSKVRNSGWDADNESRAQIIEPAKEMEENWLLDGPQPQADGEPSAAPTDEP